MCGSSRARFPWAPGGAIDSSDVPDWHPTPIHLTLLRHGDLIAVDLAETGTLIPRSETRVDDAFLSDLTTEMEHITAHRGGGTEEALSRVGGLVFFHPPDGEGRRRP